MREPTDALVHMPVSLMRHAQGMRALAHDQIGARINTRYTHLFGDDKAVSRAHLVARHSEQFCLLSRGCHNNARAQISVSLSLATASSALPITVPAQYTLAYELNRV